VAFTNKELAFDAQLPRMQDIAASKGATPTFKMSHAPAGHINVGAEYVVWRGN
jgi:hypothetical protein